MIWGHRAQEPLAELSVPEYWDLRERSRALASVAAFADGSVNLTGGGSAGAAPRRVHDGHGARRARRRARFAGARSRRTTICPGGRRVVLLSDALWRRRFGADPAIVGRALTLDDAPTTVVGIMPADFQLPSHYAGAPMELWAPLQLDPAINRSERGWHFLDVVGRLRGGVTLDGRERRDAPRSCGGMLATYPTEYTPEFDGSATWP